MKSYSFLSNMDSKFNMWAISDPRSYPQKENKYKYGNTYIHSVYDSFASQFPWDFTHSCGSRILELS